MNRFETYKVDVPGGTITLMASVVTIEEVTIDGLCICRNAAYDVGVVTLAPKNYNELVELQARVFNTHKMILDNIQMNYGDFLVFKKNYTELKCECGAAKCNSKIHSDWCPKNRMP